MGNLGGFSCGVHCPLSAQRLSPAIETGNTGRTQKIDELFQKYATAVLTMMRRAGGYSTRDKLEQLYENADPELQLYVQLEDVRSVADLCARASKFEAIKERRTERTRESRKTETCAETTAAYDKNTCCWRCKQRGHHRRECQRPSRKFCSQCGKDGVLTRECHPPGNE